MRVLLQANVPNLGQIGDLVNVKAGYARNYLLPRGFAVASNEQNKKQLEHQLRLTEQKKKQALEEAQQLAEAIASLSLTVKKAVGEEEKIFGTVTNQELADEFKVNGLEIDRHNITIVDEIKTVGIYKGLVKLHPEVSAEFKIWVVAQED